MFSVGLILILTVSELGQNAFTKLLLNGCATCHCQLSVLVVAFQELSVIARECEKIYFGVFLSSATHEEMGTKEI